MNLYKYWNYGGAAKIHIQKITKSWTEATATSDFLYDARGTDLGTFTSQDVINIWESYVVTSAVVDFVKSPSSNYGFILSDDQGVDGGAAWRSADYSDATYRPKLIVTYLLGSPIAGNPDFTPVQGTFTRLELVHGNVVISTDDKKDLELTVVSSSGKFIYKSIIKGSAVLSTKTWAPGYYVACLRKNDRVITKMPIALLE